MSRYLSTEDVALLLDRDNGNIRVLACRDRWRRIKHQGRTYYNPHDVRHTANRLTITAAM